MKRSAWLLALLALLLLTAAVAPVFKSDPGRVLINFMDWTIETSVLVLVGAVLLSWLLIQLALWLYRVPVVTARRVQEQRALKQLETGLLALTEGDWKTAEKALQKSTSTQGKTTARYLAAAQAADGQDAAERREHYLEQADTGGRRKKFLVELTRARMLMANGQRAAALPVLLDLYARRKRHPQVLEMLAMCYQDLGQWEELEGLLPALHKLEVIDDDQLLDLRIRIAGSKLDKAQTPEALQAAWKSQPRALRREARMVDHFARRAADMERADLAEAVLRASLKHAWNPALVSRYGDAGSDDASRRLKQCETWLLSHPEDASLHMTLGRLCARQELWGKARHHLIKSLEYCQSSAGYDALGQLLERRGELELAMLCFRNALRLNQGKPAIPLPADQARLTSQDPAET